MVFLTLNKGNIPESSICFLKWYHTFWLFNKWNIILSATRKPATVDNLYSVSFYSYIPVWLLMDDTFFAVKTILLLNIFINYASHFTQFAGAWPFVIPRLFKTFFNCLPTNNRSSFPYTRVTIMTIYYFDSAWLTCDQKHFALEDLILLFTCML